MKYVAFLRGINVGGGRKIRMTDLKHTFEGLGFNPVETYIQSGNVLFISEKNESNLREIIQETLLNEFGFAVEVVLRTAEQLQDIVKHLPFTIEEVDAAQRTGEGERLYISLHTTTPSDDELELLEKYQNEQERFVSLGADIYLLVQKSIRLSKLAIRLPKIAGPSTIRNWKTICTLAEMVR